MRGEVTLPEMTTMTRRARLMLINRLQSGRHPGPTQTRNLIEEINILHAEVERLKDELEAANQREMRLIEQLSDEVKYV